MDPRSCQYVNEPLEGVFDATYASAAIRPFSNEALRYNKRDHFKVLSSCDAAGVRIGSIVLLVHSHCVANFARLSAVLVEPLMSDCKGRFRYGNSAGDCLVEFLLNGIPPRLSNELATDVFRPAIDAYRYGFAAPLDIRVVMLARGEV